MNNIQRSIENALQPGVSSGEVPNFAIISASASATLPYPENSAYQQPDYAHRGLKKKRVSFSPIMPQIQSPQFQHIQQQPIAVPENLTNQFNGAQQSSYGFYPSAPIGQQMLPNGSFYPEQMDIDQEMIAENPFQNRQCSSPCFPQINQGFFPSTPPQSTNYNFSQVFPNLHYPPNESSYQQFVAELQQIPPVTQFNNFDLRDISLLSPIPKSLPSNQSVTPTLEQQTITSAGTSIPIQATHNPPLATNETGQHLSIVRFEQTSQVTQFSSNDPKDSNDVSSSQASVSPNKSVTWIQHKYMVSPEGMTISTQINKNEPQVINIGLDLTRQTNHSSFFVLQQSIDGPEGKATTTCSPNVTITECLPKESKVKEDYTQTEYEDSYEDSYEDVFSESYCSSDISLSNQAYQTPGLTSIIDIDNSLASSQPLHTKHLRISSIKESESEEDEDNQVTKDQDESVAKKEKMETPQVMADSDEDFLQTQDTPIPPRKKARL